MTRDQQDWTKLSAFAAAIGMFFTATMALTVFVLAAGHTEPGGVEACEIYNAHGPQLRLTLTTGATVSVSPQEVGATDCPRAGTWLEKRRWELDWRVAGERVPTTTQETMTFVCLGIGIALLVLGVLGFYVQYVYTPRVRRPLPRAILRGPF
jgi:hypothetical protein